MYRAKANARDSRMSSATAQDSTGEAQQPIPCVQYTHHTSLWFVDGSVIIQAETTLFRVHMSQLSRHSAFFKDLFSLPQPPHLQASNPAPSQSASQFPTPEQLYIDKCPVLEVQDTAEDFANLLSALYDGPTFGNNDRDDYRIVSGILRLATKYLIDKLRNRALSHLMVAWPTALKAWDTREEIARNFEFDTGISRGMRYPSPIVCASNSLLRAAILNRLTGHHQSCSGGFCTQPSARRVL
jgi:hypothetical protein